MKLNRYWRNVIRGFIIFSLAVAIGYIHYKYVSTLFENARNFSHLSDLEREMSLRTEMGFYYSYFKTIAEERPFIASMSKLLYDKLVEYPNEVNALNRFNIQPELLLGALYVYLEPWIGGDKQKECSIIDRGENIEPVESCVGVGVPVLFYLGAVWVMAGVLVGVVFVHAYMLSGSLLGAIVTILHYFTNHSDCTRVQWHPNERENFAAPFIMLQTLAVTLQFRNRESNSSFQLQMILVLVTCLCLLFWQFSQFVFLTQTAIFFIMEQLRIIDLKTLCLLVYTHFCGLHMAVLFLQGNDMLKSSLYTAFLITLLIESLVLSHLRIKIKTRMDLLIEAWLILLRIGIVISTSIFVKKLINNYLEVEEDSHIWEILYSKFTNYKSFHTLIYTCSEVFDFLPVNTIYNLCRTLLIPLALLSCINMVCCWVYYGLELVKKYYEPDKEVVKEVELDVSEESSDDSGIENNTESKNTQDLVDIDNIEKRNEPKEIIEDRFICFLYQLNIDKAIFYNISQMVVFGVMAGLFMRLKLLFVTQMCVVASIAMNAKSYIRPNSRLIPIFWTVIIAYIVRQLWINVEHEMSYEGEFCDLNQEQLLQWISTETSSGAAFAGSMPVLATVMLTTRRPIVAHPHYEHKNARERAYAVYKTYGRFSLQELYEEMTRLRVSYLIVEKSHCYGTSRKGCTFQDIWDVELPQYAGRPSLCHTLLSSAHTEHFYRVFNNAHYAVYRVHDLSVRYMPRAFAS